MIDRPPSAMRLVTTARVRRPPRPPFHLRAWAPDADARAVVLDGIGLDPADVAAVARQLPPADSLHAGAMLAVYEKAARGGGLWTRIARGRWFPVSRAVRCGALVARGYVNVGAGRDEASRTDLAWGWAPGREPV